MRPQGVLLVAVVLCGGLVHARQPADEGRTSTGDAQPMRSVTGDRVETAPIRPIRSRFTNARPRGRLLSRFFSRQDQTPAKAASPQPEPSAASVPSAPIPSADSPFAPGSTPREPAPPATSANPPRTIATGAETESRGSEPITGNPAAVNIIAGTGALGRALGLERESGIRLGGLWLGDSSGILTGGKNPGRWGLNSLAILDLNLEGEKLLGWNGGSLGTQFLQFNGQNTNSLAGAFPGFDSIEAGPPLNRSQLYQLWFRQSLLDDRLIFRIGKTVPTFDFNNVSRPVPVGDPAAAIPAVTSLAYTPIFVNPTMLGVIPGYYNSATGITTTFSPFRSMYLNYGFYDGNLAAGQQTGFSGPRFNGYYFHIGELGAAYRVGPERKPGNFGVGIWGQTGKLVDLTGGTTQGAAGVYLFGAQRIWFRNPGVDSSGVSGFYQFGANNSNALHAREYVGGGLTAFGLVPNRPADSFGLGLNCTWLTQGASSASIFYPAADAPFVPSLRPSQLMFQCYYQMQLLPGWYFQTNLTDIPTPGIPPLSSEHRNAFPNALAITLRLTVLF